MGTISHSVSLCDALFSKVQQRVLAVIFTHPERSFYTSEIVRRVHSGVGAVQRELSRLERSGLVSVERIGNQKHYRANRAAPIFEELRVLVEKTVGLAEPIRQSFGPYADAIKSAFIYGSVAKGTDTAHSDIDLMVIGDNLNYSDLYTAAARAFAACLTTTGFAGIAVSRVCLSACFSASLISSICFGLFARAFKNEN